MITAKANKKVLIVTYYWPPSGGGGVQRWLKFAKYLPEYGWMPIIYTPENPTFELKDHSLSEDIHPDTKVIKKKIWEPFEIYKKLSPGNKNTVKQGVVNDKNSKSIITKLIVWIRGNLFFPDPRRFWVKPSVNFLEKYIAENEIKLVVSTGPPHSMHLIGLALKKKLGDQINWVADFRDPWSEWDLLKELKTSRFIMNKHKAKEKEVLLKADAIVTVSESLASSLSSKVGKQVEVITNGYDIEDIPEINAEHPEKFIISHIGLMNELRNPSLLWDVIRELCLEVEGFDDDLQIFLAGAVSGFILQGLKSDRVLSDKLIHHKYIPHERAFYQYGQSSILLLLVNTTANAKWILPGKAFEYIAMKRPILTLGQKGIDLEKILVDAGHSSIFNYEDKESMKDFILKQYSAFKMRKINEFNQFGEQFERKNLTGQLSDLLENVLSM